MPEPDDEYILLIAMTSNQQQQQKSINICMRQPPKKTQWLRDLFKVSGFSGYISPMIVVPAPEASRASYLPALQSSAAAADEAAVSVPNKHTLSPEASPE
jgi:hypothetical protein